MNPLTIIPYPFLVATIVTVGLAFGSFANVCILSVSQKKNRSLPWLTLPFLQYNHPTT